MYIAPLWNQILSDLIHCYIFQVLKILDHFLFVQSQIVASQLETAERFLFCIITCFHYVQIFHVTEVILAKTMTSTNSISHMYYQNSSNGVYTVFQQCDFLFFSEWHLLVSGVDGLFQREES